MVFLNRTRRANGRVKTIAHWANRPPSNEQIMKTSMIVSVLGAAMLYWTLLLTPGSKGVEAYLYGGFALSGVVVCANYIMGRRSQGGVSRWPIMITVVAGVLYAAIYFLLI
jgi:xanthine/uracil permease